MIPYGAQYIDEDDVAAVVEALRSDWLTTGPRVEDFEATLAAKVNVEHCVALSSGTAALHAMMQSIDIGPGDEVLVPALTFVATANSVVYQGATPIFVDVEPNTLCLDSTKVEMNITSRTRAIVAVDYAGHPCDYRALQELADKHGLWLLSDACHSLGAQYRGKKVGQLATMTAFSFHPVKHITTGEGGAVVTNDRKLASRIRVFRNHGIDTDFRERERACTWEYGQVELGFNYRITDIQCALGLSQLKKLDSFLQHRRSIASRYLEAFSGMDSIVPLKKSKNVEHAYHLFVVRLPQKEPGQERVFKHLRSAGIGVNVHYRPVYLHPYYRMRFGMKPGRCPVAEQAYGQILSLPVHPGLSDNDVKRVIHAVYEVMQDKKKK